MESMSPMIMQVMHGHPPPHSFFWEGQQLGLWISGNYRLHVLYMTLEASVSLLLFEVQYVFSGNN